ncbi:response regulator [bacterium]|nr:response regulator [bacterium]
MRETILVVDDNAMMRTFLGTFLSRTYDVYLAQDGEDALHWLSQNEPPSAIIADIDMPNMNGYTFLNIMMGNMGYAKIPVLMISPDNSSERRIKCYEMGAQDVMSKPFNPIELEHKLKRFTQVSML